MNATRGLWAHCHSHGAGSAPTSERIRPAISVASCGFRIRFGLLAVGNREFVGAHARSTAAAPAPRSCLFRPSLRPQRFREPGLQREEGAAKVEAHAWKIVGQPALPGVLHFAGLATVQLLCLHACTPFRRDAQALIGMTSLGSVYVGVMLTDRRSRRNP